MKGRVVDYTAHYSLLTAYPPTRLPASLFQLLTASQLDNSRWRSHNTVARLTEDAVFGGIHSHRSDFAIGLLRMPVFDCSPPNSMQVTDLLVCQQQGEEDEGEEEEDEGEEDEGEEDEGEEDEGEEDEGEKDEGEEDEEKDEDEEEWGLPAYLSTYLPLDSYRLLCLNFRREG